MDELTENLITKTTKRARAAFAIGVCEILIDLLEKDHEGTALVRKALDVCWEWETTLRPTGDEIFYFLFQDQDDGLILYESLAEDKEVPIWISITTAILYISWLAFNLAGEKDMPDPLPEVDDESLKYIISNCQDLSPSTKNCINSIGTYLLENHYSPDAGELGKVIPGDEIYSLIATCN